MKDKSNERLRTHNNKIGEFEFELYEPPKDAFNKNRTNKLW